MYVNRLRDLDFFGTEVNFFYKGAERFSTGWGRFVSVSVLLGYSTLVGLKFMEFFGETDQIHYFSETRQSMQESIELSELGFTFAVQDLQPNLGRIQAYQVKWSGTDGLKTKSPIDLVECDSLTIGETEKVF